VDHSLHFPLPEELPEEEGVHSKPEGPALLQSSSAAKFPLTIPIVQRLLVALAPEERQVKFPLHLQAYVRIQ
jgi:hypothetical protein